MPGAEVALDGPGGRRKGARRQQRRRLDVEQRPAERLGNGATERAEHAQADDGVGVAAGGMGIFGHLQRNGAEHGAHGPNRLERVGAARLHELASGVAGHDLLDIAAQGAEGHTVALDKGGEILRRSQADLSPAACKPRARTTHGWMSPREPAAKMVSFMLGPALFAVCAGD